MEITNYITSKPITVWYDESGVDARELERLRKKPKTALPRGRIMKWNRAGSDKMIAGTTKEETTYITFKKDLVFHQLLSNPTESAKLNILMHMIGNHVRISIMLKGRVVYIDTADDHDYYKVAIPDIGNRVYHAYMYKPFLFIVHRSINNLVLGLKALIDGMVIKRSVLPNLLRRHKGAKTYIMRL